MAEILTYFGKNLADILKISAPAARGLLRLSIMDEFGPFKPVTNISMNEMKLVIEGAFKLRLIKLEIRNYNEIIDKMLVYLRKNQSLITMGGV